RRPGESLLYRAASDGNSGSSGAGPPSQTQDSPVTSLLLTALDGGILTLTLNRPDKRNALSSELIELLHRSLEAADLDSQVRVVLLRGAGKDFCAGADLEELLASVDQ